MNTQFSGVNEDMLSEVLAVNRQRRIAAVRKNEGITVFSWDGSVELSEGDLLQGDLEEFDGEGRCFNASVGEEIGVMVMATGCSDDGAVQLLFVQ
jgi:hypothetical protein